jgi:hypothetical protein
VQRGDAEMSQKLWRVVRSCVEMGDKNPIVQIHDQGGESKIRIARQDVCLYDLATICTLQPLYGIQ